MSDPALMSDIQEIVYEAVMWWYTKGQHNPEYGGDMVDAIADDVVRYIENRDRERQ